MRDKNRLYQKKPGGVWYGWYYTPTGERLCFCTKCTDRKAAIAALKRRERETQAASSLPKDAPTHTVADALDYLVGVAGADLSSATLQMYARKGGHLLRLLGEVDANTLHIDEVQEYISDRLDEGAAPESVRKELCTLRRALSHAHDRRILVADPRTLIPPFKVRYVPRDRYLTEGECARLLAALPEHRRLWVQFAVYTGARASEVEAVQWDRHVNLDGRQIVLPGTKTAKSHRKIPLAEPLAEILSEEGRRIGQVIEPWPNVRRDLAAACKRAGIARVSPNDLRRTFASWLKQAGVDSMTVAKLLGHTSSRMVELVYGRLNDLTLPERRGHAAELACHAATR